MRKQTWIVNLLLIAAAGALSMKLRADWMLANQRYATLAVPVAAKPGTPLQVNGPASGGPAVPGVADSIVQGNLFSPDRNNVVAQIALKAAAPPLPVFLGGMDIGSGPLAFMVETGVPGTRQVRVGQMIGAYKLVKVAGTFVMVEYEGEQKRVDLSMAPVDRGPAPVAASYAEPPRTAPAPAVAITPAIPPVTNKPTPTNPSGNSTGNPDTRTSYDMFGPGVGKDTYPAGAIVDGWRKVEHPWPFGGKQTWWERVKQ